MSPVFLMLPGRCRWELVELDRPDRPLISGSLREPVTDVYRSRAASAPPKEARNQTQ